MTTRLILGGTGKTGRRGATRLPHDVRVGWRSGQPPFDWTEVSTWAAALARVDIRTAAAAGARTDGARR